ncbi:uncharacterized protein FOMMEDRAFT_156092 [Fomitiporia mediterranea MF3/22]|uniref:uncharacterized protein n=1 Tax=Fomitiporia mediterranea (strain MF3/22) TaxID=694068 RepID=UPI00044078A8|nr:uncharacterized protein FOMMEDRAFT_156092 [Fomitiporia mediterranea MF3/22]EJD02758.1 hypothetical protein FOMMEDRAFT_156092 [Fomitiporia mediterranea MF3/22]
MPTHISVLPEAVLDVLCVQIDEQIRPQLELLRLPHPRTGILSLFLPFETANSQSSILELQNVAPTARRSWFHDGEVLSGDLLLMTPLDPVFLLVPFLRAVSPQDGSLGNFRTLDDIFEDASVKLGKEGDTSSDAPIELVPGDILELSRFACIHDAMRRICDTKDVASDLVVFRYSHSKLLGYLEKKATRLAEGNLLGKLRTLERELAKDGLMEDGKEDLLRSGRIKLACDLISQYLAPDIYQELLKRFDFSALTAHITALREADAVHETSTTNSAAQKAQINESQNGKKRKAGGRESTGIAKLKKANINGMSKLSSFFQKKS